MKKVKAIFVSHEHSDHISGIKVIARKYQLPVYITEGTQQHCRMFLQKHLIFRFRAYHPVQVGELSVTAFPKFHDAGDPHSFIVASPSVKVGIFTDIGKACQHVIHHFRQCHAAFLEANYDEEMLVNGTYPIYLKRRIMSDNGHLSNAQALALVMSHRPSMMSHLLLSHLSKNNNCPKLVEDLFTQHVQRMKIIIASRYEETMLYHITNETVVNTRRKHVYRRNELQLSLFGGIV